MPSVSPAPASRAGSGSRDNAVPINNRLFKYIVTPVFCSTAASASMTGVAALTLSAGRSLTPTQLDWHQTELIVRLNILNDPSILGKGTWPSRQEGEKNCPITPAT
jgi:hypothetical protein